MSTSYRIFNKHDAELLACLIRQTWERCPTLKKRGVTIIGKMMETNKKQKTCSDYVIILKYMLTVLK
jgi:hypothetical protein